MALIRLGVTGTDTGVGKTTVSRALLHLLRARGWLVEAMKPVETGVGPDMPMTDAHALRSAAASTAPAADVCPVILDEPLAPWMAARRAGRKIDITPLDTAFGRLAQRAQAIVVEGAGGALVPLTRETDFLTLFHRWRLGVIIVAANRLGAINHTLLTVQAVRAAALPLYGVVLNELAPDAPDVARATNADALRELLGDVPVVSFPWLAAPNDDACVARAAEQSALAALIDAVPRTDPIQAADFR